VPASSGNLASERPRGVVAEDRGGARARALGPRSPGGAGPPPAAL